MGDFFNIKICFNRKSFALNLPFSLFVSSATVLDGNQLAIYNHIRRIGYAQCSEKKSDLQANCKCGDKASQCIAYVTTQVRPAGKTA